MGAETPPFAIQGSSHSAQLFRLALAAWLGAPLPGTLASPLNGPASGSTFIKGSQALAGGVVGVGDFAITQNGTPNMTVNVAGGQVFMPGGSVANQGLYYGLSDAATSLAIAAANVTNPRIDTVVAVVDDAAYSGAANDWKLAVVTGTPTSGATLSNLSGVGSLAGFTACVALGYVLVPANATTIITADILNSQPLLSPGFSGLLARGVPSFRAYRNAAYSNVNNSLTLGPCDTVQWDNAGAFNTGSHLYVCTIAGTYQINGAWSRSSGLTAGQAMSSFIQKNGSTVSRGNYNQWTAGGSVMTSAVADLVQLAVGDTVGITYKDVGGGSAAADSTSCYVSGVLVSA